MYRILVERAWGTGRLHHYYHFVAECLWPLFVWLEETGRLNDGSSIFFADHNVSYFREILEELFDHRFSFPAEPEPVYFDAWRARRTPLYRGGDDDVIVLGTRFHAGRMAAFHDETTSSARMSELRDYCAERLRLGPATQRTVVFVQRERAEEIDLDRERPYQGQGHYDSRGAARRFTDFEPYAEMLRRSLPREVDIRIVRLATMPFRDQVAVFRDALAVVGDHGAGMVNAIWSEPGLVVIEICGGRGLPSERGRKQGVSRSLWSSYRFAATLWSAKRAGVQFDLGNFMHIGIPDLRATTRWHVVRDRNDAESRRVVADLISSLSLDGAGIVHEETG